MNLKKNIIHYGRFKGAPWFDPISQSAIFIGGGGGIGSHLAFMLARTGANIVVVDPDTVSEENLAGQLYGKEDVGKKKVVAISNVISRLCGDNNVIGVDEFIKNELGSWQDYVSSCDVVCVGFDNLQARAEVFKHWLDNGKEPSLFVDGRLGFEGGQVFVVDKAAHPDIIEAYKATYFSDAERHELPCTMKATTHCGSLVANLMVAQIVNWFGNIAAPSFNRSVRNIEFHLPFMIMEATRFKVKKNEKHVEASV